MEITSLQIAPASTSVAVAAASVATVILSGSQQDKAEL